MMHTESKTQKEQHTINDHQNDSIITLSSNTGAQWNYLHKAGVPIGYVQKDIFILYP